MPISLYIYIGLSTVAGCLMTWRIRQLMADVKALKDSLTVVEKKTKSIVAEE